MARKRKSDEGGISLDSLMDALTNVVAVLILVLILVQADVSQKVQKFIDEIIPATPEEIATSQAAVDKLKRELALAEARLRESPPTPEDIKAVAADIFLLEKSIEENKHLLADLDKLRKLESTIRAERETENQKTTVVINEIAKLEAMLDDVPEVKTDNATVVKIPNSRPIPDNAKMYQALALGNRIHIIDTITPIEVFNRELERNKNAWIQKRIKTKGEDRIIYDRAKILNHFRNFDWKNTRNQKLSIDIPPTRNTVHIVVKPDLVNGGTPLEELGKPGNEFASAVAMLKRNFSAVLMFRVKYDSYDSYLKARDLVDGVNIAAGWEMTGASDYYIYVPDVYVERTETPPEKKPEGPKPPPLKPKLD